MHESRISVVLAASLLLQVDLTAQRASVERALGSAGLVAGAPVSGRRTNRNVSMDPGAQNEVAIAIAPDDPANVVVAAHDYRSNFKHIGVWTSPDGGRTFKGGPLAGIGAYGFEGDPAVAAHRNGVFYLSYVDHGPGANRVAVARSDDGGGTWPRVGVVVDHPTSDFPLEDKPYLAVDDTGGPFDGTVYVTWVRFSEFGESSIFCARSTDGGASFEQPVRIDRRGPVTGPVPVVGPGGELYLAWRAGNRLRFSRSHDGGVTFTGARDVADAIPLPNPLPGAAFRVSSFPTLAVDRSGGPHHGTLYLAWADKVGLGSGPDVLLRRSANQGTTWSPAVRVSDDVTGSYQFFPWMCVGHDGVVHIVFHDQRESPHSPRYHTTLACSLDGGSTFERNLRLSDEETDTSLDPVFLGTFIGDYIGIAASPLAVYPVWTDLRPSLGQMEVFLRPLRALGH